MHRKRELKESLELLAKVELALGHRIQKLDISLTTSLSSVRTAAQLIRNVMERINDWPPIGLLSDKADFDENKKQLMEGFNRGYYPPEYGKACSESPDLGEYSRFNAAEIKKWHMDRKEKK